MYSPVTYERIHLSPPPPPHPPPMTPSLYDDRVTKVLTKLITSIGLESTTGLTIELNVRLECVAWSAFRNV